MADIATEKPGELLRVQDLTVHFVTSRSRRAGGPALVRAVDGVSFAIAPGTTFGLVGESGCGKTTTARAIVGLTKPTSGNVWFDGCVLNGMGARARKRIQRQISIVFQDASGSLNPRMCVRRIIAEPLEINGVNQAQQRARTNELLAQVGLRESDGGRYPHELSGGQRQRVGIARALALEPRLLVLDEPVSALDVSVQAQILNLLRDLQRDLGLTYLFIGHQLPVVEHFCDQVAVMYSGKIVEIAPCRCLFAHPAHPYTQTLLSASPQPDPSVPFDWSLADVRVTESSMPNRGCTYQPRCAFVTERCGTDVPVLLSHDCASNEHLVACHNSCTILSADDT